MDQLHGAKAELGEVEYIMPNKILSVRLYKNNYRPIQYNYLVAVIQFVLLSVTGPLLAGSKMHGPFKYDVECLMHNGKQT